MHVAEKVYNLLESLTPIKSLRGSKFSATYTYSMVKKKKKKYLIGNATKTASEARFKNLDSFYFQIE